MTAAASRSRIVFRCDAGSEIGMGHWARCRALASWFDPNDVLFIVAVDAAGATAQFDGDVRCIPYEISEKDECAWWRKQNIEADAILLDVSHAGRIRRRDAVRGLLAEIGGDHASRIVIDGLGVQTLVDGAGWKADAVLLPYAATGKNPYVPRTLSGAEFFVLPRAWGAASARNVDRPVRHILITMGGSDPRQLSSRALEASLRVAGPDWAIHVVVGPAFARDLVDELQKRALTDDRVTLIDAPAGLLEQMLWADLAISSTGLTKYELAWAGLPSVQISIDEVNARLNETFEAKGTAIHLGAADNVDAGAIAVALTDLIADVPARTDMSRRGQALVDGMGGARVAQAIKELIDARA